MALVGACLADGLHYAHERGLLYLDLKPTNVLLAADAQPLLLDFHLAVHPLRPGQPAPEWFGGTPGYMSPEQEAACAAAQRGGSVARGVDGRSDIHALGRLLYLALTGEDKIAEGVFPLLHQRNPRVSRGLSDLIHKCLAECPEDRYPNAAAVAADLRRHLAHLPLRGVPNRDLGERCAKWLRRRPAAALWTGLVLALLTGGAMLATVGIERFRDAQIALAEAQGQMQRKAYREAVRTLVRGEARVKELPGSGGLVEIFETHLHQARRAEAAEDLHAVAEVLRFLAGAAIHSTRELKTLDVQCGKIWAVRGLLTDQAHPPLETGTADQVRSDLLDLSLLWTDLKRRLASQGGEAGDGPEEMVRVLAEAERLLGPSPALTREQHRPERTRETHLTPGSDHDRQARVEHVALGHSLLRSGDLERAAEELDRAVDLRPQDFWANFYRGACAYRLHQYADAVHSFGVAIALVPRSPECYYNRALAHAAWGKKDRARNDYDHALALAPQFGAAALNRGVLYYQEGRWSQARADLEQALRNGAEPATATTTWPWSTSPCTIPSSASASPASLAAQPGPCRGPVVARKSSAAEIRAFTPKGPFGVKTRPPWRRRPIGKRSPVVPGKVRLLGNSASSKPTPFCRGPSNHGPVRPGGHFDNEKKKPTARPWPRRHPFRQYAHPGCWLLLPGPSVSEPADLGPGGPPRLERPGRIRCRARR